MYDVWWTLWTELWIFLCTKIEQRQKKRDSLQLVCGIVWFSDGQFFCRCQSQPLSSSPYVYVCDKKPDEMASDDGGVQIGFELTLRCHRNTCRSFFEYCVASRCCCCWVLLLLLIMFDLLSLLNFVRFRIVYSRFPFYSSVRLECLFVWTQKLYRKPLSSTPKYQLQIEERE